MMESVSRTRSHIPVPVYKGRSNPRPRKPLSTLQLKNTPSGHPTLAGKTTRDSSALHPTCMSMDTTPRPDPPHVTPRPDPSHVTPSTRARARKDNLFEKWVQSTIKSSHHRVTQQSATSVIMNTVVAATPIAVNTATPVVDTVKLNLEAQLTEASNCSPSTLASHTNKHIRTTSKFNFYEIEEELLKLPCNRVFTEDGEGEGRRNPIATLLNQYYFVPVSQSSMKKNVL